ncbi:hypothetical protein KC19_7G074900 [Ceratodon purpureus]|uniref:Uncharacterized protein n=1 Tax=Ceratodon purpureus TaxID=3225 RepID=A0A8T0H3V5_CERPU|nr:hypothetical protein KC19_7G074900 [Ceratodon purpureus]
MATDPLCMHLQKNTPSNTSQWPSPRLDPKHATPSTSQHQQAPAQRINARIALSL